MKDNLREFIREAVMKPFITSRGKSVDYGSQKHIDDLQGSLDELIRIRNRQGRTSKSRYIYARAVEELRKKLRVAKRYGLKNNLIEENRLRKAIRMIAEGGLKAPDLTRDTVLTPEVVAQAVAIYVEAIELWNKYLAKKGARPVKALGPVGSTAYYKKDLKSNPGKEYGDVDYLVAFPVEVDKDASPEDERKAENLANRVYTKLLVDFLSSDPQVQRLVNVPATVKSSPTLLIVKLPDGQHVQVDTIVTHPQYVSDDGKSGWMPARWTPERGLKGYTLGNVYAILSDRYNLSISDRGILAKTQAGSAVPFKTRKNVKLVRVGKSLSTIFADIANYLTQGEVELDDILIKNPGMNTENITISSAANGIVGLVNTLESAGIIDSASSELSVLLSSYKDRLQSAIDSKKSRGLEDDKYEKLLKLNDKAYEIVKKEFEK